MSDAGEPASGDLALACVTAMVDELVRGGVSEACVSPGSRSTPLALALARHPGVRVRVHLDERSSAFFALGLAKALRRPVAVACTSGTAVANLFPAVVEARYSGTPMVLLTADRPPELRDTGANQTIDQLKIFGDMVRWFAEAGMPESRAGAGRWWRSLGSRAVAAAMGPPAGPVHVNLPFREPLVPAGPAEPPAVPTGREQGPWELVARPVLVPDQKDLEALVRLIQQNEAGAVVVGRLDMPAPSTAVLAAVAGWPLIAEPASGLREPHVALAAGQHLLADEGFRAAHRPDAVLQIGAAPTTRAAQAFVSSARVLVVVSADAPATDPSRGAAHTLRCEPELVAADAARRVRPREGGRWIERWKQADAAAAGTVASILDGWDQPFEGRVARDLGAWIPDGGVLVVGSSMPVRDLDAFLAPRTGLRVLGNRGASGIDGFVSTTLGVAAAGAATFALTGDLSMVHDLGALYWNAPRGARAVLVVVNNDGGGVFDLLPQAGLPEHEELFVTPHRLDLAAVASAARASHVLVERASDLPPALDKAAAGEGIWIVEVPIDRGSAVRCRAELRQAVGRALEGFRSRPARLV